MSTTLSEIAKRYPTDKDFTHNFYNAVYNDVFEPIRQDVHSVCEIGIGGFSQDHGWVPGNSLRVWRDFFPHAEVQGFDIEIPDEFPDSERITIEWFDQSKRDTVIKFADKVRGADIIVDDGSHNVYDQQLTFAHFFRVLKPGGIYVIEDLQSSFEVDEPDKAALWGWGIPGYVTPLELLDQFQQHGNYNVESHKPFSLTADELNYLTQRTESVQVHRIGPTSITSIIKKKAEL